MAKGCLRAHSTVAVVNGVALLGTHSPSRPLRADLPAAALLFFYFLQLPSWVVNDGVSGVYAKVEIGPITGESSKRMGRKQWIHVLMQSMHDDHSSFFQRLLLFFLFYICWNGIRLSSLHV